MRKPFFWKSRGAWYVKVCKSQLFLDADEGKAYRIWQEMQQQAFDGGPRALVWSVAQDFMLWAQRNVAASTFALYQRYVVKFCDAYATRRVAELKPFDLNRWLDSSNWNGPSRSHAIAAVKRCFNWATHEGLIAANPFASVKKPQGNRRETLIADDQHKRMAAQRDAGGGRRDGAWRALIAALRLSGGRPGTVTTVTALNVSANFDAWVMQKHKTRGKTGKPLIVWLSPCLQTLTRIMAAARKTGPLFLNSRGRPWTKNAINCRMRRVRTKLDLPKGTAAYSYRHTFTTNALLNGLGIATVAELQGHKDIRMIAQHYGHLDQHADYLRQAAANALIPSSRASARTPPREQH
jgi:site-specific recombinase XerD